MKAFNVIYLCLSIKNYRINGTSSSWCILESNKCCWYLENFRVLEHGEFLEWYLNCCKIFQAGLSCQLISTNALSNILLQTVFNCNLSTVTPVAMTNSCSLVNLLNIIAFCYFDKSIMLWFTYALRKIFIGIFYTKLCLVYTNKASVGLILMVVSHDLNDIKCLGS